MAEKNKTQNVAWITFNDGEDVEVEAMSVLDYTKEHGEDTVRNGALVQTELGDGLYRLDAHINAITDGTGFYYEEGVKIPIFHYLPPGDAELRADVPYFVVLDGEKEDVDAELWTCHTDALSSLEEDVWEWCRVGLRRTDPTTGEVVEATSETVYATDEAEDGTVIEHTLGEAGLDPEKLIRFHSTKDGKPLTYGDLLMGVWLLSATLGVAVQTRAKKDKPVTIRVAEEFPQLMRAATKRSRTRGITLKNRKGKEVTSITAIEDFLELKPSGRKTMVKLNQEATRLSQDGKYRHDGETVCRVVLNVKEISELYGITEASARKRLRRDFKAIANECITVKRGKSWVTIPVAGDVYGISGDSAMFALSPTFMQLLLNPNAPQTDLPPEIFSTDDTNYPAALQIGFKLYNHDNQNYGKPNQDRITLTALLHAATELPTAEAMTKARRSKTNRIMGPFEATMDHLVSKGVLKAWDYCHENGEPLTDEEYATIQTEHDLGKPTPWELAEGLLVTWELGRRYALNEEARQASRDRRRAQALEAKAAKKKEAKAKEKRIRGKVETMEAKKRFEEAKKAHA